MGKAAAALSSWRLFSSQESKEDDAKRYYEKATVQFKAAENYGQAAKAYRCWADLCKSRPSSSSPMEIGMLLDGCGKMSAAAGDTGSAILAYQDGAAAYEEGNQPLKAAALYEEVAKLATSTQEQEVAYYSANRLYTQKGAKVSASRCLRECAMVKVAAKDYMGAAELFDFLGREALEDRCDRSGAFRIFFQALLCLLAQLGLCTTEPSIRPPGEVLDELRERFDLYQQLDTNFTVRCREHMCISALLNALTNGDAELYDATVKEFVAVCPQEGPQRAMLAAGKAAASLQLSIL